jgi:hypothetical protein
MEYPRDSSPDCYETRNSQHSPNVPGRKSYPGGIAGHSTGASRRASRRKSRKSFHQTCGE